MKSNDGNKKNTMKAHPHKTNENNPDVDLVRNQQLLDPAAKKACNNCCDQCKAKAKEEGREQAPSLDK